MLGTVLNRSSNSGEPFVIPDFIFCFVFIPDFKWNFFDFSLKYDAFCDSFIDTLFQANKDLFYSCFATVFFLMKCRHCSLPNFLSVVWRWSYYFHFNK